MAGEVIEPSVVPPQNRAELSVGQRMVFLPSQSLADCVYPNDVQVGGMVHVVAWAEQLRTDKMQVQNISFFIFILLV